MSAEQQAAYWEQWNAYCAHYYQQPDPQYAGYQQYQVATSCTVHATSRLQLYLLISLPTAELQLCQLA